MKNDHSDENRKSTCPAPEDIVACLCNEVNLSKKEAMEKHVETCPSCRALTDELKATIQALRECPSLQKSGVDLTDEVLKKIPADAWEPVASPDFASRIRFNAVLRFAAGFVIIIGLAVFARLWMQGLSWTTSPTGTAANVAEKSIGLAKTRAGALKDTLQWLASVQEPSGRWDAVSWGGKKEYALALNGLALLAFARNQTATGEDVSVIDRAVKYIVSCQNDAGLFGEEVEGMMYNHGIVTVALLETYAATRDASLKEPLDKAINFIRNQQLVLGGWSYANRPGAEANTSVSVWQLQALLLSARLGWEDREYSLRKGLLWLGSMADDGGQFGYERPRQVPEGNTTLTAMGAFCMFTASEMKMPCDRNKLLLLKKALVSSKMETAGSDFYRCYFRAAALNASKEGEYSRMLAELQHSLLAEQEQSGGNTGSWSPEDRWGSTGGRIYSTAVAALTLEIN
jgi:hypothetical protein